MTQQWKPVATRGAFAAHVMTIRHARSQGFIGEVNYEDSVEVRGTRCRFLVSTLADGEEERHLCWFTDEHSVREWLREMQPHTLEFLVGDDESAEVVAAAIDGKVH